MATRAVIDDFLAQDHLALVGASRNPKAFSSAVYRELREHGHTMHPVNTHADTIEGDRCYRAVADLPPEVGGAVIMVAAARSAEVVAACVDHGVPRIWLHKGAGPSSVSDEAVAYCDARGIPVVDGACPLMFSEPAGVIHRIHRFGQRITGRLPA